MQLRSEVLLVPTFTIRRSSWRTAAAALVVVLAVGACSGGANEAEDRLCQFPADTAAGNTLRQVLGTDDVETAINATDEQLREHVSRLLDEFDGRRPTSNTSACSFQPKAHIGAERLRVEFSWVPPTGDPKASAKYLSGASHYNLGGVLGESNDIGTGLRVACRLRGKPESDKALLYAQAANGMYRGRTVDQEMKNRQIEFLYFQTRNAVQILGCENGPLTKDPDARPYSSAEEAAEGGQ
ncbi:hypothetical protein QFZ82_004982 [Streptomyces sp. V4I23]|uniref:hypothetical protein n=1 Tax=Streptomyces sp. V4I23 TaxID=3042282 RepID=UPI002783FECE|nr:hypothetical protein [Streptomyces sp. V4I23]MDQ1010497.1 hypothetical protein [Streptomyces sp. V4I23]